jgi:hypothetical protein
VAAAALTGSSASIGREDVEEADGASVFFVSEDGAGVCSLSDFCVFVPARRRGGEGLESLEEDEEEEDELDEGKVLRRSSVA